MAVLLTNLIFIIITLFQFLVLPVRVLTYSNFLSYQPFHLPEMYLSYMGVSVRLDVPHTTLLHFVGFLIAPDINFTLHMLLFGIRHCTWYKS